MQSRHGRLETRQIKPFSSFSQRHRGVTRYSDTPSQKYFWKPFAANAYIRLQTTTAATTLSAGRIGGSRSNILNATDLHASTGKGTESGLGTRAGGLGTVTTSGTDLDVQSVDAKLLATGGDVLGSQHGSVGGGLVTVSLDLHTTSDTGDGFTTAIDPAVSMIFPANFACVGAAIILLAR